MAGLRERKKQQTRDALLLAAHQLFVDQGYDATTVDTIADRVEVSQRTFFRYFASKEEVAFHFQDLMDDRFVASVTSRPHDEPPPEVLRAAFQETCAAAAETLGEVLPLRLYLRMWRTIEVTPSLLAVHLRRQSALEDRLCTEIARRTDTDPDLDPRPHVLVAAFCGVLRAAARRWSNSAEEVSLESARDVLDSYVTHLPAVLPDGWGRAPRDGAPHAPQPRAPRLAADA